MKCPVCKSKLKITDYHDDHIVLESDIECMDCQRYKEQYAYGSTGTGVKLNTTWRVWGWDKDTPATQLGRINVKIGQAVKDARAEWATDNKKDYVNSLSRSFDLFFFITR